MGKLQRGSRRVGNRIPHHINYTDEERQLAALARGIAMSRDALYHGTRTAGLILKTGVLLRSLHGAERVCLTRSAEVAAYWSLVEREYDERRASILIFDRHSLGRRYEIAANPEVYWHLNKVFHDEAEEEIRSDVVNVSDHLIGFISGPWRRLKRPASKECANRIRREIEIRARAYGHDR